MIVWNITDDYDSFTNSKQSIDDENDNIKIFLKLLLLSIQGGVLLLSLMGLKIRTTLKTLFSQQIKNGYIATPKTRRKGFFTGPSEFGKSRF